MKNIQDKRGNAILLHKLSSSSLGASSSKASPLRSNHLSNKEKKPVTNELDGSDKVEAETEEVKKAEKSSEVTKMEHSPTASLEDPKEAKADIVEEAKPAIGLASHTSEDGKLGRPDEAEAGVVAETKPDVDVSEGGEDETPAVEAEAHVAEEAKPDY